MDRILRARPSPATLIALVALFVALGGTAFSALRVDSSKVVNNSLKSADLKNKKGVKDVDVVPNGLTGKAINEATLSGVNAATATNATNADMLDNLDSTDFLRSNAAAGGDLTGNYPSPSIATGAVGAGEIADGSLGTGELASSIPAVHVTHPVDQSIPTNSSTPLAFNQERYDTAGMHDTATNNSRLTAPVTGIYAVTAQVDWGNSMMDLRELSLRKNGTTLIALESSTPGAPGSSGRAQQELTTQVRLAAGDFVEAVVFQDSGGTLEALENTPEEDTPEFSMTWLAPGP